MARWTIEHSNTWDFSDIFQTILPQNLHFIKRHRDIGSIEYSISLSATDPVTGDRIVSRNFIRPYGTYWRLKRDNKVIMAGWHTALSGNLRGESVSVQGKDWADYLGKRHFPFDPRNRDYYVDTNQGGTVGVIGIWSNVDAIGPVKKILDETLAINYSIDFTYQSTDIGCDIYYRVDPGDTSSVLSLLDGVANSWPGFEWDISPARHINFYVPFKYGVPSSVVPVWTFLGTDDGLIELSLTNNGITATHILGQGTGNTMKEGWVRSYLNGEQEYSRIDLVETYEILSQDEGIYQQTIAGLADALQPQHEVNLVCNPEEIPDFWNRFEPGFAVGIVVDLEWHKIENMHQILDMDVTVDNNANELVTMNVQVIQDLTDPQFQGYENV